MIEAFDWCGRIVLDAEGEELGKVDDIYLDLITGRFEWALVCSELWGARSHLVPLAGAQTNGQRVTVNVSMEQAIGAPIFERASKLSQAEERRLSEHYGLAYDPDATGVQRRCVGMRARTAGQELR
ncbi:MAG: PRC-barrel domain-containing protein [Solirubrobacteraceae bacterium]